MAKITIIIEDQKDEENRPKIDIELIYESEPCDPYYYSFLTIPPKTIAEEVGFTLWREVVDEITRRFGKLTIISRNKGKE